MSGAARERALLPSPATQKTSAMSRAAIAAWRDSSASPRADVLLAVLPAEQVRHWREDEERDAEGLAGSLAAVVSALAWSRPTGWAGA
ncbi:hypothetical protein ACI79G_07370 [Geodermatophilus sp. SYSU D00779]